MNKAFKLLIFYLTSSYGLVLNERSKTLFVQINQQHMISIFNSLQSYSTSLSNNSSCNSEKHMYVSIAQNLREGKIYSNKNKDRVFLGWTPLTDDNRMLVDSTLKPASMVTWVQHIGKFHYIFSYVKKSTKQKHYCYIEYITILP